MCGLAGFLDFSGGVSAEDYPRLLGAMVDAIRHRGPDDKGYWFDTAVGVGLGHCRLAILDLTPAGYQPMCSPDRRYVLVFNGEIYNHNELRHEIEVAGGWGPWRGHSDTEVMLAAFAAWGVEKAVARFTGMFAFALWDAKERMLCLGRDRFGEKPLYYGLGGKVFFFGSELKALRGWRRECEGRGDTAAWEIDREALALYFRHHYVPAPASIYRGIRKLPPASLLRIPLNSGKTALTELPPPKDYWRAHAVMGARLTTPFRGDEMEAAQELERLLRRTIRLQTQADVPLGAFLSGGIDSSTVTALMQEQNDQRVHTFTIGFHEEAYDESRHARRVASYLDTDHTDFIVSSCQAMEMVETLPGIYDEPYADSSAIPTCLLARLARRKITISLTGDGGDELFGGYPYYGSLAWQWRILQRAPPSLRATLATWLKKEMGKVAEIDWLAGIRPRLARFNRRLPAGTREAYYYEAMIKWADSEQLVQGCRPSVSPSLFWRRELPAADFLTWMMLTDICTYLPDDLLVKMDRASMAASLETRAPLLDHEVYAFVCRLPTVFKTGHGVSKRVLRRVLYRRVPQELMERPKMGFGVPLANWLRGPLLPWVTSILEDDSFQRSDYLRTAPILRKWREHRARLFDWSQDLWSVLMFQEWLRTWT